MFCDIEKWTSNCGRSTHTNTQKIKSREAEEETERQRERKKWMCRKSNQVVLGRFVSYATPCVEYISSSSSIQLIVTCMCCVVLQFIWAHQCLPPKNILFFHSKCIKNWFCSKFHLMFYFFLSQFNFFLRIAFFFFRWISVWLSNSMKYFRHFAASLSVCRRTLSKNIYTIVRTNTIHIYSCVLSICMGVWMVFVLCSV